LKAYGCSRGKRLRNQRSVVQRAAHPGDVALVVAEERPEGARLQRGGDSAEAERLAHHQGEHEAAVCVE